MQRDFTTNIKHVLPAPLLETYTSAMFRWRHCLSSLIVVSSVQAVQPLGGSSVLPTSSLRFATGHEQQSGRPSWQPQRCSVSLYKCSRKVDRPSAIDFVVPAHPSWPSSYLLHCGTLHPEILPVGSFRGFRRLGCIDACCCDHARSPWDLWFLNPALTLNPLTHSLSLLHWSCQDCSSVHLWWWLASQANRSAPAVVELREIRASSFDSRVSSSAVCRPNCSGSVHSVWQTTAVV